MRRLGTHLSLEEFERNAPRRVCFACMVVDYSSVFAFSCHRQQVINTTARYAYQFVHTHLMSSSLCCHAKPSPTVNSHDYGTCAGSAYRWKRDILDGPASALQLTGSACSKNVRACSVTLCRRVDVVVGPHRHSDICRGAPWCVCGSRAAPADSSVYNLQ